MGFWDQDKHTRPTETALNQILREGHEAREGVEARKKLAILVNYLRQNKVNPDLYGQCGGKLPFHLRLPYGSLDLQLVVRDPFFISLDDDILSEAGVFSGVLYQGSYAYRIMNGRITPEKVSFTKDLAGSSIQRFDPSNPHWIKDLEPELERYAGKYIPEIKAYNGRFGGRFRKPYQFMLTPRPGLLDGEPRSDSSDIIETFSLAGLLTE